MKQVSVTQDLPASSHKLQVKLVHCTNCIVRLKVSTGHHNP